MATKKTPSSSKKKTGALSKKKNAGRRSKKKMHRAPSKKGLKKSVGGSSSRLLSAQNLLRLSRLLLIIFVWVSLFGGLYVLWISHDLPERLKRPNIPPDSSITFLAADGTLLARYGSVRSDPAQREILPPHLIEAILAIEDRHFYSHYGIAPASILRAAWFNMQAGRVVQGGSTITQQLAKNLFLTHERTFTRKIREVVAAFWLEANYSKDEILTAYVNHVYMGSGIYGMGEAAQYYFNKKLSNISLFEAATLAGMLKAPSVYAPSANPYLSRERAIIVLSAMVDAGYLNSEEIHPFTKTPPKPGRKPVSARARHYFTDFAMDRADDLVPLSGKSVIIETTLDPQIQKAVEKALGEALLGNREIFAVSQGAVIVLNTKGDILAMAGGYDYKDSQYNRAVQARRQPGSAFKPLLYAAALEEGWTPEDKILDAPIENAEYKPENYNNTYYGEVSLTQALALSLNTAAVRLYRAVGEDSIISTVRRFGITAEISGEAAALGSAELSLLELTRAYAVIANNGYDVDPHALRGIYTSDGTLLYAPSSVITKPARLFPMETMLQLNNMLETVILEGTGKAADPGFKAAGKTGTSQNYRDAWFIGYAGQIVIGVWLGNDDNSPMLRYESSHKERVTTGGGVTGGGLPARIWQDIAKETALVRPDSILNSPEPYESDARSFFETLFLGNSNRGSEQHPPSETSPFELNN